MVSQEREEINWSGDCPCCPLSKAGQPELCRLPRSSRESFGAEVGERARDCRHGEGFYGSNAASVEFKKKKKKKKNKKNRYVCIAQSCLVICTSNKWMLSSKSIVAERKCPVISLPREPREIRPVPLRLGSLINSMDRLAWNRLSEHMGMLRSSRHSTMPEPWKHRASVNTCSRFLEESGYVHCRARHPSSIVFLRQHGEPRQTIGVAL